MIQATLLHVPIVSVEPVSMAVANGLMVDWGHRLGPVNRPFHQEAYTLSVDGSPVSVATSGSSVSTTVDRYRRNEVVELTRLCSDPEQRWATRVMLRLWRAQLAQRWECWPVKAGTSYSHNAMHAGDIYRFDGWERIRDDCGSSGGGSWSTPRDASTPVHGSKTLWIWRYL